ncbi:MAG: hypothetical protein OEZ65_08870 [Gemmatimonadota bacterium]|nr:hypothetical protein [Gemmatimonadota bacterium]MDH5759686.1 hypothetical protein [Gemmatimonadota bacterium]
MPVSSSVSGGIVTLVVDGDHTAGELRRECHAGHTESGGESPFRVIVDISGASGVRRKSLGDWQDACRAANGHAATPERIAILGYRQPDESIPDGTGPRVRGFLTREAALDWVSE